MILNSLNDPVGWTSVVRMSDLARNATVTRVDDGVLQFDVIGGEIYQFDAVIVITGSAGGFAWNWASSAGTLEGATAGLRLDPSSVATFTAIAPGTSGSAATATAKQAVLISGWLKNTINGTVTLQWAQNSSNAAPSTVMAGSFLRYRKV